jgi:hypothetical protein
MPLPDHINARPEDLASLIDGMIAFDRGPAQALDAVIAATVLAFGFVYAHPFEDGNGRIHRYLIHHILAERGFNPPGVVFQSPPSSRSGSTITSGCWKAPAAADRMGTDARIQCPRPERHRRLLPLLRYFDATPHAELLYACVQKTIEGDLPAETRFLRSYDDFRRQVEAFLDMPERLIDLLFRFLSQNDGRVSQRARAQEFSELTDEEAQRVEAIYGEFFKVGVA